MSKNSAVYIICGVFNNLDYTKKLLHCIKIQTYKNIKAIIIDDGSTDGTSEYIQENYPNVIVLKGRGELWWTGAIYWGVEEVLKVAKEGGFVLTINNDCTFDENYISTLVAVSAQNNRSIVGSLVVDERDKKTIIDAGVQINWSKGKYIALGPKYVTDLSKHRKIQDNIDTLSTKGTLYPIEVFKKIGNFNKRDLPHYISDYEFNYRAKRNGFKLILSYEARVYNDTKRTGLGESVTGKLSYSQLFDLLFSRRSKQNIVDQWKFITLCCPLIWKPLNYFFVIIKLFYLLSLVFPFNLFSDKWLFRKQI